MLLLSVLFTPIVISFVLFPRMTLEFFWSGAGAMPLEDAPLLALIIMYAEVTAITGSCFICWYLAYKGWTVRRNSRRS